MQTLIQQVLEGPQPLHCYQAPGVQMTLVSRPHLEHQVLEKGTVLRLRASGQVHVIMEM